VAEEKFAEPEGFRDMENLLVEVWKRPDARLNDCDRRLENASKYAGHAGGRLKAASKIDPGEHFSNGNNFRAKVVADARADLEGALHLLEEEENARRGELMDGYNKDQGRIKKEDRN
jgi:hypothetical protein